MAHERAVWRGVTVCRHMVANLDAWALAVGDDVLLDPVQGSYSDGENSAGTHLGGGAIDINAVGLTPEQRRRIEAQGRKGLILAWYRSANDGPWDPHVHALDPRCHLLAVGAKAQFEAFRDEKNGLANDGADEGDRTFARQILNAFDGLTQSVIAGVNFRFPYGPGFPVPGEAGSMYGPSTAGEPLYSGTVALDPTKFKHTGTTASGFLALTWIRAHIKRIQHCLDIVDDGKYQDQTFTAVKAFQHAHHLVEDGKVGPVTWKSMARSKGQ